MKEYKRLCKTVLRHGEVIPDDRTGTGTIKVFGETFRHDLRDGFPLLTTKYLNYHSVIKELIWFLNADGDMNERDLDLKIWEPWADKDGNLGPIYGSQWRSWPKYAQDIDQWAGLIDTLRYNPYSRRQIMATWNVAELDNMKLPPCHGLIIQANVGGPYNRCPETGARFIDLNMYQRSADLFLGVPWNIASYATMLEILATVTGYRARNLHITFGDLHIYSNHVSQVKEQLKRRPKKLPWLEVNSDINPLHPTDDDFVLKNYFYHPKITGEVSV